MRKILIIFFIFYAGPFFLFSGDNCFFEEFENSVKFNGEKKSLKIEFETSVEVSAECFYPHFHGDDFLINYVNKKLKSDAYNTFESFVDYEQTSQEEYDKGFGGCYLEYQLFPVYCLPKLISICGIESQARACPHGWTHFEGKNFWRKKNAINEIELRDLFLVGSDWSRFIIKYCDNYFRSIKYGYYATNDSFTTELEPEDLNIFLLTGKELIVIFRSYRVGGWADGPDVVLIPYSEIKEFIDPEGPLKEVPGILSVLDN